MPVRLPFATLVALVADRLALLAYPPSGEPSPVASGAGPAEWAACAGIGCTPDAALTAVLPNRKTLDVDAIDPGEYEPEQLAHVALRRLRSLGTVETTGPSRYRPVRRAG